MANNNANFVPLLLRLFMSALVASKLKQTFIGQAIV